MNRCLTNLAEMRRCLPSLLQRLLRTREASVSSHKKGLFSEELLLSASVLFLPVLYMTAALALLSGIGLGRWVFPTGLLLWGGAVVMHFTEKKGGRGW